MWLRCGHSKRQRRGGHHGPKEAQDRAEGASSASPRRVTLLKAGRTQLPGTSGFVSFMGYGCLCSTHHTMCTTHTAHPTTDRLGDRPNEKDIDASPPDNCTAGPIADDPFHWQAMVCGPEDSPYRFRHPTTPPHLSPARLPPTANPHDTQPLTPPNPPFLPTPPRHHPAAASSSSTLISRATILLNHPRSYPWFGCPALTPYPRPYPHPRSSVTRV